jgi:hypothetical protein
MAEIRLTERANAMNDLSQRLLKAVGCHFVTLSSVQRLAGREEAKVLIINGFIVEAGGIWFYITAGHILSEIRKSLEAGVEFDLWRFGDQTTGNGFSGGIPYAFDVDEWSVIEDEGLGLDCAVLALDPMYRMQLEAGGAIPISKEAWGDQIADDDLLALIGIPYETLIYDQKTNIRCGIVVIPLDSVEKPPKVGSETDTRFSARLQDSGNIKDIKGMSGGPVFAVKKVEGRWEYKLIGVQSGWYPSKRIILVCPFVSLGIALESVVASSISKKG